MPTPKPTPAPDPTVWQRLKAAADPFGLSAKTAPPSERFRQESTPPQPSVRPPQSPFGAPKYGLSAEDEDEYKSKSERALDYGYTALDKQNADADALRTELEKYSARPQQLDLTPLMSWADKISGSDTAKTYKAPETPQDKTAAKTALLQGIIKAQGGITEKEAELLKNNVDDFQKLMEIKQYGSNTGNKINANETRQEAEARRKAERDAQDDRNKFQKEYGEGFEQSSTFAGASSDILDILDDNQGGLPTPASPDYAKLKQAHAIMLASYNRGVAKLGALSGGDEAILNSAIAPIKDFASFVTLWSRGGGKTLRDVVENARNKAAEVHDNSVGIASSQFGDSIYEMKTKYDNNFRRALAGKRGKAQAPAPVSAPQQPAPRGAPAKAPGKAPAALPHPDVWKTMTPQQKREALKAAGKI